MSCIAKGADFFFFETERIFAGICQSAGFGLLRSAGEHEANEEN